MNRGRHKKIKISYNKPITLRCYFNEVFYYDYIRIVKNIEQLTDLALHYLKSSKLIKKVEIRYKNKLIKIYQL